MHWTSEPLKPRHSQLNAHDAVDLIDLLIRERIAEHTLDGPPKPPSDDVELIKRELTDFFLALDPRPGLYVKGPND